MEGLSVWYLPFDEQKIKLIQGANSSFHRHKAYILTGHNVTRLVVKSCVFRSWKNMNNHFFGGVETKTFQKRRISSSQLDFSKEQRIFSEKKMKIGDELATMLRLESYITVFPVDTSGDGHEQGHHTWIRDPGTTFPQCHVSPKK